MNLRAIIAITAHTSIKLRIATAIAQAGRRGLLDLAFCSGIDSVSDMFVVGTIFAGGLLVVPEPIVLVSGTVVVFTAAGFVFIGSQIPIIFFW
jgi:hypothetical protein